MNDAALNYAVDSILSVEDGLDANMVRRILRSGVPLYTSYLGAGDAAVVRQALVAAQADQGFSREKAHSLAQQAHELIGSLLAQAADAEARAEAAEHHWPQWAKDIFKRLQDLGLYQGMTEHDEVDLAEGFTEWVDTFEDICKKDAARLEGRVRHLEERLADQQAVFANSLIEVAQAEARRVLHDKVSYFRSTNGHYDRSQAAGSYEASAAEVEHAIGTAMGKVIAGAGARAEAQVSEYRQADGRVRYMVEVHVGERKLTTDHYDIQGRAEFEAAEWNWLIHGGATPDISDFDVDLPGSSGIGKGDDNPLHALEEVRYAAFGDLGSSPDLYADYDRLCELSGKMRRAIAHVEHMVTDRARLEDEVLKAKGMLLRTADQRMGKAFYVEVCRAEDRIKDIVAQAKAVVDHVVGGAVDAELMRLLRTINDVDGGNLIPDQISRVESMLSSVPADIRAKGWAVAVHNDYRVDGVPHTFWLFTKGDLAVKGEGLTDTAALDAVRAGVARLEASNG